MNDDIFERFIKSVGIVLGGYFLLYLMIITTQKRPIGIALKIVAVMECIAKGLFYLLLIAGISFFVAGLVENHLTKQRIKKKRSEEVERERQSEIVYLKQEIDGLKHRLEEANNETKKYVVALHEEKSRGVKFENHLKNRSAEEAVNDPLKHFM